MFTSIDTGLYYREGTNVGQNSDNLIAAFDLDWTLTRSVKGLFSKSYDDWKFLPNRINILKDLINQNYTIVIFTNQLSSGKKLQNNLDRVQNIVESLIQQDINPYVFISSCENIYRKPNCGMWTALENILKIDKNHSFFVGDAAGRPQDFSDTDKSFAQISGIKFYVPEEIFPNNAINIPTYQSMFIFVGCPGSGKTTYYENNLKDLGWIHANQDTLKTHVKVLKEVESGLSTGKSVVIDETNPSSERRKEYLELAVKYQIPTLIVYFVRNGFEWNKLREKPVPRIAYNMYFKNLIEPDESIDGVSVIEIF
jgi:bifunctional polynucleotide phosphatase/kinase